MRIFVPLLLALLVSSPALAADMPDGWLSESHPPNGYEIGTQPDTFEARLPSAFIHSVGPAIDRQFGVICQVCRAEPFRGKRVRFKASMEVDGVGHWAGLWLDAEDADRVPLTGDDMRDRPLHGTSSWQPCEVVVDVPPNASVLSYGAMLNGEGWARIAAASFEVVDKSVALTHVGAYALPEGPSNLDFEPTP